MSLLNANVPFLRCRLRKEFLYNLEEHHGELVDAYVFGACSIRGRALGFHCMTDVGGVFWRLPLHAFVHKDGAPALPLDHLQLWDCLGYHLAVTRYDFLRDLSCRVLLRDRKWYAGQYLFTLDWCHPDAEALDTSFAEHPDQHKCGHFLALDNGCFAVQPNNRILWQEKSFVTNPPRGRPDYRINTHVWFCESGGDWAAEDSDRFFYDTPSCTPRAGGGEE